ncbi:YSIRK-type signal peptide-containing protein, partial [Helcococcus ovis]
MEDCFMIKGNKIEKKPKYGMRKLSLGLCSVVLGFGLFMNGEVLRTSNSQNTVYASDSLAGGAISNNSLGDAKVKAENYGKVIVVSNLEEGHIVEYIIDYKNERGDVSNLGSIEIKDGKIVGRNGNFKMSEIVYNKKTNDKIKLKYTKEFKTLVLNTDKSKGLEKITLLLPGGAIENFYPKLFKNIELSPKTPKEPAPTNPKEEKPKKEEPKKDLPKKEEPKKDLPKKEEPKKDLPKKEEPKKDLPKKEEPKKEEPKKEEPKKEEPKKEEPK